MSFMYEIYNLNLTERKVNKLIGLTNYHAGGVTTMQPFLKKFFPAILRRAALAKTNMYCVYDSHVLTAFTSSLYIAGLAASLVAGRLTRAVGRRNIMIIGGVTFLAGSALNGGAENITMLILGRILLGFGVGFTNQVIWCPSSSSISSSTSSCNNFKFIYKMVSIIRYLCDFLRIFLFTI